MNPDELFVLLAYMLATLRLRPAACSSPWTSLRRSNVQSYRSGMSYIQRAIDLAVAAHRDMEDPPGVPYILHPLRVMMRFEDPLLQAIAVLHDTIERAGLNAADFRKAGLPKEVLRSVKLLTHERESTYADYVVRLSKDEMARVVKIADLSDNADLRYVDFPPRKPKKGTRRVARYALSHAFLTGRLSLKDYRRLMKNAEN